MPIANDLSYSAHAHAILEPNLATVSSPRARSSYPRRPHASPYTTYLPERSRICNTNSPTHSTTTCARSLAHLRMATTASTPEVTRGDGTVPYCAYGCVQSTFCVVCSMSRSPDNPVQRPMCLALLNSVLLFVLFILYIALCTNNCLLFYRYDTYIAYTSHINRSICLKALSMYHGVFFLRLARRNHVDQS